MKLQLYKNRVSVHLTNSKLSGLNDVKKISNGDKALLYIFLAEDLSEENPLATVRFDEREALALETVFGNKELIDIFSDQDLLTIDFARQEYRNNVVSEYNQTMASYDRKLDELNDLLQKTTPVIRKNKKTSTGEVTYSSNISILTGIFRNIISIIITKTKIIEAYLNNSGSRLSRGQGKFTNIK